MCRWVTKEPHLQVQHAKGSECTSRKKGTWCNINAGCNDPHFFLTKLYSVITMSRFFILQCSTSGMCLFLYLVLLRFLPKTSMHLLIQIGWRENERVSGGCKEEGRSTFRGECLSQPFVYTWQTLIIIIMIIISKRLSKLLGICLLWLSHAQVELNLFCRKAMPSQECIRLRMYIYTYM